ncbi:MAG: hypothetical protein Q4A70_01595 [Candidatus Saccharibacteria bacterium]|nr:hypothetical protein [Candidatus Saccharibacteria bacterium]
MHKGHIIISSFVGAVFLTGAVLMPNQVSADDSVVDQINIAVPVSCTMSGTGMNTHNAEIQNNTYTADIGATTLHAFCNDSAGFAVYAVGYTDNEFGKNVLTNATLGSTYDIATGTAESGNTSNWAMKLAIAGDSGDATGTNAFSLDNSFGGYHNVPAEYTKVAHKNSATDMTTGTGGVKLTTTYAAFINKTQPAGTYNGQVKYTLVHPASEQPVQPQTATSGCINYFANASTAEGTMGCQSISSSATSAKLFASNFSREGYGFAGWSDAYDYATNANANFYGPNEDITFTAGQYTGTNDGLALYAVWVKSAGSIQSWSGCSSLASGAVTALTDQRDNETYAVAKLADGNCWMIENLRLESTAAHNSDGTLAQGYGASTTYGNFSGLAAPENADKFSPTYAANNLYSNDGSNDTINIGTSNAAYRMPRFNNVNTPTNESERPQNPTAGTSTNSTSNAGMYSYGNYYTWHAAIADLNPNNTNNQSTTGTSLCPTGWHLPTGGGAYASDSTTEVNKTGSPSTYREFYNLGFKIMNEVKTAYEDTPNGYNSYYSSATTNTAGDTANKAFRKYPNNFVYSGYVYSGSVGYRGIGGYYWSSTYNSPSGAYSLDLVSGNVYPGTDDIYGMYSGRTIRCLVAPGS